MEVLLFQVPDSFIEYDRPKGIRRTVLGIHISHPCYRQTMHVQKEQLFCPLPEGSVSALDDAVGKVVKSLEDNGMAENTVVVFVSDVKLSKKKIISQWEE